MITRRLIPVAVCVLLAALLPGKASSGDINTDAIVVKDPHYGEALYYFYQEDYFPAIVRLLAAQRQGRVNEHADEAELLLGGLYLSYGHHLRAAEIFEQLLADNVNADVRDRTWFFLAKIWHQRGYLPESAQALENIVGTLPGAMESERSLLQAQLLIDDGQHADAIGLLTDWTDETEWSSYARFNLAVAMVRSGQVNNGAAILDDLGRMDPFTEELRSLRDKANLALGYAYLQDGQPLAAKPALQRVRLEGPFSNKALLGVGWADAEAEDYARALVPWMELKDRNLLDPAVQESMLAIPYAMAQLDSVSQAADHYLNAIEAFYEESNRIDAMVEQIEDGLLFDELLAYDATGTTGWYWNLDNLPEGPESRYLYHLLSTNEFQEGLKNFRDLNYLADNLDDWRDSIDVFRNMLETRELAYTQRLPRVENSLANADLEGMVQRKLQFDAHLNSIELNQDALALASRREFELWGEISAIEQSPAANADIPEAEDVRDKVRLLKGVLQWELEREFKARLATIRSDLRQTGEALVETQRSRRQVDDSMRNEPLLFQAFNERVEGLSPQINASLDKVNDTMNRQRAFLQSIAVNELLAQKQRLNVYTVQARFALAAIYDRSAATVGQSER